MTDYVQAAWAFAVAKRIEPEGDPWNFTAMCPVKAEHGRVFQCNEGSDRRVVLYCAGGCWPDEPADALELPLESLRRPRDDYPPAVMSKSTLPAEPAASTTGVDELRALLGAVVVDVTGATLDPAAPLPGLPFVLPLCSHLLAGANATPTATDSAYSAASTVTGWR